VTALIAPRSLQIFWCARVALASAFNLDRQSPSLGMKPLLPFQSINFACRSRRSSWNSGEIPTIPQCRANHKNAANIFEARRIGFGVFGLVLQQDYEGEFVS